MRYLISVHALVLFAASIITGPGVAADLDRPALPQIWARTELYFGTQTAAGEVSDLEFAEFLRNEITPRFPNGLTLVNAYGQYRDAGGRLQKERSKLLIVLYPLGDKTANARLEELRRTYKQRFRQESVLRVDSHAFLSF